MVTFNDSRNAALSPLILSVLARAAVGSGNAERQPSAQAVADLSKLFTKDRSALAGLYLDNPAHVAAYLQYFLPVNLSKIQALLSELPEDWAACAPARPLKVLDIGSGPGTGVLAVLDWLYQRRPEVAPIVQMTALDASRSALLTARRLWEDYSHASGLATLRLTTTEGDLEKLVLNTRHKDLEAAAPYDLIIVANCLNELWVGASDAQTAKVQLLSRLLSWLTPQGSLMVLEPALRETSRALHQIRDHVIRTTGCTVYSPCLHNGSCPALVNPFDWCHEERPWNTPASIQAIDREVGFIKDALKFSYVLLRTDGRTLVERRPDRYRVVSELRVMKGEKRAWLCSADGRSEIGRQDRLVSPTNGSFDDWHRGAIVQIDRVVRKEKHGKVSAVGRIDHDATVRMVRPV